MGLYLYLKENYKYLLPRFLRLNPVIMENAFNFKNLTSSFRNAETLNRSNVNSIKYGNSCLPRYQNVKNFTK